MKYTKTEAIDRIKVSEKALPYCLRENYMDADRLLFREAQFSYSKRKTTLQKQIVIDNLQYLMQRQLFEFTFTNPKEIERQNRNRRVIDMVRKYQADRLSSAQRKEMQVKQENLVQKTAKDLLSSILAIDFFGGKKNKTNTVSKE